MKIFRQLKIRQVLRRSLASACLFFMFTYSAAEEVDIKFNGYGWVQMGQIMQQSDSIFFNFNGNWMQSAATQVTALVKINDNWDGALGIGGGQSHRMQSRSMSKARELKMSFAAYITQARFSYGNGDPESGRFESTFGFFPYNYNPSIKNLGLYLLRGPVYPGVLESGFEVPAVLPIANIQGAHLSYSLGPFTQDLLLFTELEYKPLYDFSIATISRFNFADAFEIGFGINFYHILPLYSELATPSSEVFVEPDPDGYDKMESADFNYIHLEYTDIEMTEDQLAHWDTTGIFPDGSTIDPAVSGAHRLKFSNAVRVHSLDTTWLSNQGIKTVGFFNLDPKPLLGLEGGMSPEDLKLYFEIGLIGIKNYPGVYENRLERMPMVVGLNFPVFGFLDNLTLEVEYYQSPYRQDIKRNIEDYSPLPRSNLDIKKRPVILEDDLGNPILDELGNPIEVIAPPNDTHRYDEIDYTDLHSDDWKWSLHMSKTIQEHIKISGQVANDHFRPAGTEGWGSVTFMQIFTQPDDWYWMTKVLYFF